MKQNAKPTALHKIFKGGHVEISRNFPATVRYCQKEESRVEGYWSYGEMLSKVGNGNAKRLIDLTKFTEEERIN